MQLNLQQAQLARIKAAVDAKNQLRLCYDTVLQVGCCTLFVESR